MSLRVDPIPTRAESLERLRVVEAQLTHLSARTHGYTREQLREKLRLLAVSLAHIHAALAALERKEEGITHA